MNARVEKLDHKARRDMRDLTSRELQILDALAGGYTNAEIAAWLEISDQTLRRDVQGILDKTGAMTRAQACFMYGSNVILGDGTIRQARRSAS